MATLAERIRSRKRASPQAQAEAIATEIWRLRIENAAAKNLLGHALSVIQAKEDAVPLLVIEQRIRTFLERHP